MKKRWISLLLAATMLLSMLPTGMVARAEEAVTGGNTATEADEKMVQPAATADSTTWEYATYGTGIAVTAYHGAATDVYVPAMLDGKTVLKLGDGLFANNDAINSVTLAEGILEIGEKTFYDADQLVCIVTAQSLTTIGAEAFYSCDSFNSVILYDAVTTVGENAFAQCPVLTIWCNEGTAGYTYATTHGIAYEILNPNATPEIYVQGGVTYYIMNGEAYAIDFDESTTEVTVPAYVEGCPVVEIRAAFQDCASLTKVILPDTVLLLGEKSFANCGSLVQVVLPNSVRTIGERAFYQCTALKMVNVPDNLTAIGEYAFMYCRALADFEIPSTLTVIAAHAFSFCALTEVVVPGNITVIKEHAFSSCGALKKITISEGVTKIGQNAFSSCAALESLSIAGSVDAIEQYAFSYCQALTSVTLNEGIRTVGSYVFRNCRNLIEIELPKSIESIGIETFSGCTSLQKITMQEGLLRIYGNAFKDCDALKIVQIPKSVEYMQVDSIWGIAFPDNIILMVYRDSYAHTWAMNNEKLFFLYDGTNEPELYTVDDVSYYIFNGNAIAYDCDKSVTAVTVPEKVGNCPVTELRFAFKDCTRLTSLTLPTTLQTIGKYAFYGCSNLTSLEIPESVTYIGEYAFAGCGKMKFVNIPEGIMVIEKNTFYGCIALTEITIPKSVTNIKANAFSWCSGLTEILIPDYVGYIGENAFSHCSKLNSVILPQGLTGIGEYAFDGCKCLKSITIPSSVRSISKYAFRSNTALTEVVIQEGTTTIRSNAFCACSALEMVVLPKTLTTIYTDSFPVNTILLVYIDSYAQSFAEENDLFYVVYDGINLPQLYTIDDVSYCVANGHAVAYDFDQSTTSVVIPAQVGGYPVTKLYATFESCHSLTAVTLPNTLEYIGERAFYACWNLTSLEIPEGVTVIDEYAFYDCGLTEFTFPKSLRTIGDHAFWSCNLVRLDLNEGLESIGSCAFEYCKALVSVTIPSTLKGSGSQAFMYCTNLKEVTLRSPNTVPNFRYSAVTDILYPDGTEKIGGSFNNCSELRKVIIPHGVTTITSAFVDCPNLQTLLIPESVVEISGGFTSSTILLVYESSYAHAYAVENNLLYFVLRKGENPEIAYGSGISGIVSYTDGTAATGASVEIFYDDGTLKESVKTDSAGAYSFTYAEVGRYTIRVTDAKGNTATTQVSVKRMNAFDVFLSGDTNLVLKKGWTISGTVSESPATVTLTDEAGNVLTAVETANGSFVLDNIPNGTYFVKAETENGSVSQEVTVFDGDVSGLMLTVATQTATIWGYVEVEDRSENRHRRNWVQVSIYNDDGIMVAQTRSDRDGKYIFTKLPLGAYSIVAETAEMRPDHKHKGYDRSYQLTGYAYVDAGEAGTYQAEDIVLYEENDHTATIAGKVTAHGQTQNCEVIIRNVFHHEVAKYTTGKNGKYTFKNIPDGLYFITARTESDGMGYTIVAVRYGTVHGDPDITVYKSDKIKAREDRFYIDFADCRDETEAFNRRERIAEEKRFYDGLSKKEKDQLSEEYVRRLNELVEWAASCEYTSGEGVAVQSGGLAVSGAELEEEQTVTFQIGVTKREKWETSTDGVNTREDFIQHEMEDVAGDREIHEYYEITMIKTVDGKEHTITSVCKDTETTGKFRITVEIPEEHRGHKHYSFIHVHHGEAIELVDLDDDPNTVTFEVDRFSTFALTYTDEEMVKPNDADIEVYLANGSVFWPESNEDAVSRHLENPGSYIRVEEDGASIEIPEGEAVFVDLNGKQARITGSGVLYGMDSANDAFEASAGTATVADTVAVMTDVTGGAKGYRYIALTADDGSYSFHRLEAKIKAVTLRTTAAGVYYQAVYNCDEMLAAKVGAYGVVLSVNNMPGADFLTEQERKDINRHTVASMPFESGAVATSGSVFGIMKTDNAASRNAQNGERKIYANAYLYLDGYGILVGDTENAGKTVNDADFDGVAYSLYDVLKVIDSTWSAYEAADQAQVKQFYGKWAQYGMDSWADQFENMDA